MNYEQTLDYLYMQLPMYQRIGASAFKKDLTNIIKLCNALGNPERKFKSIHVAGTNGKGSTSHILSAIYQHHGYKVGLYTSPHLVDFRERIKIDGELCSQEFVTRFVAKIKPHIVTIQPSFFEITVAMAFSYFAEQKVDLAIIETGLGGRLDSTNVIIPLISIITSIGYDHTDMLGDTLEKIAAEKAGIIKQNIPIVVGQIADGPLAVIREIALQNSAPLSLYTKDQYDTDLAGTHQQWNIGSALQAASQITNVFPINTKKTKEALLQIRSLSNFTGRWQILANKPLTICDVGHNEEGFRLISEQVKAENKAVHYILGFVNDKDLEMIIPSISNGLSYHFVRPQVIRGMEADIAKATFAIHNLIGSSYATIESAVRQALLIADEDDLLFIGGSNFIVADILTLKDQTNIFEQK